MPTLDQIILWLQSVDPFMVYAAVFIIAYIENIFPPFPSDVIVVFGGSLVAIGRAGFAETLLTATVGSTLGFITMYKLGDAFGDRILEKGRIPFIPVSAVKNVESWFRKYGYWLIIANRFMAGTRAVVSFFAGLAELNLLRTTVLSFVSALTWNAILVGAGYALGKNWEQIRFYLTTYFQVITGFIILILVIWAVVAFLRKNSKDKNG